MAEARETYETFWNQCKPKLCRKLGLEQRIIDKVDLSKPQSWSTLHDTLNQLSDPGYDERCSSKRLQVRRKMRDVRAKFAKYEVSMDAWMGLLPRESIYSSVFCGALSVCTSVGFPVSTSPFIAHSSDRR